MPENALMPKPRPEASSYQPTWRDYVTMALKQAYGADQRRLSPEEERLLSGFTGSSGIRGSVGSPTGAVDALTMFAAPQSSIPRALAVGGAPQWVDAGNALALEQPKKAVAHGAIGAIDGLINRLGGGPGQKSSAAERPPVNALMDNPSQPAPTGPKWMDFDAMQWAPAPRGVDGMTVYRGGGRESGKVHQRFNPDAAPPDSHAAKLRAAFASPEYDVALQFTSSYSQPLNKALVQKLELQPGKYFDPDYRPHMEAYRNYMAAGNLPNSVAPNSTAESRLRQIAAHNWMTAEQKHFQNFLKSQGFDGWWAREGGKGTETIGVFEKGQMKNPDGSTFWTAGAAAPLAYGATRGED